MSAAPVANGGTVGATASPPPPTASVPADSFDLLPAPTSDVQGDDLSLLYALQARSRQAGRDASYDSVERAREERERLQAELRKALREAAEARRKARKWGKLGKILGKVARIAAVVGSIAAAVATAGAATPIAALAIAGAVLSTAGFVVGETKALENLPNREKWAFGLSMAGGLLSCGACFAAGLSGGAQATSGFEEAAAIARRTAFATGGAAQAGAGVATIPQNNLERSAKEHEVDADEAELDAAHQRWLLDQVIASLEHMEESENDAAEALARTIEAKDTTLLQQAAGAQWKA